MKQVYSARDEVDAYLAKGFLDQEGIESVVQMGGLGSIRGELTSSDETLPSIWVNSEDVDRATAALTNFQSNTPPATASTEPWKCPNCGEMVEPQFTACWHCGASQPDATKRGRSFGVSLKGLTRLPSHGLEILASVAAPSASVPYP